MRGISLIEIVVAVSILVMAMVPLFGLMGSSHSQISVSADEVMVSQIALEILEQIEAEGASLRGKTFTLKLPIVSTGKLSLKPNLVKELNVSPFPDYLALACEISVDSAQPKDAQYKDLASLVTIKVEFTPKKKVGKSRKEVLFASLVPTQ